MKKIAGWTLVACAALLMAPGQARTEDASAYLYELKGGVLAHDVPNMWSSFSRERGMDLNLEAVLAPKVEVLGGAIRPALGGSFNTSGDTSKVYLDARYEYEFDGGAYVNFGLGGAWHNGQTKLVRTDQKALGAHLLFHIPVEIGYRWDGHHGLSLYFDHISNGYTQDANEGLDTLGIRYGYRF
ncbi:hypothetical protein JCM17960_21840 [Magnetospira thiophila]